MGMADAHWSLTFNWLPGAVSVAQFWLQWSLHWTPASVAATELQSQMKVSFTNEANQLLNCWPETVSKWRRVVVCHVQMLRDVLKHCVLHLTVRLNSISSPNLSAFNWVKEKKEVKMINVTSQTRAAARRPNASAPAPSWVRPSQWAKEEPRRSPAERNVGRSKSRGSSRGAAGRAGFRPSK